MRELERQSAGTAENALKVDGVAFFVREEPFEVDGAEPGTTGKEEDEGLVCVLQCLQSVKLQEGGLVHDAAYHAHMAFVVERQGLDWPNARSSRKVRTVGSERETQVRDGGAVDRFEEV